MDRGGEEMGGGCKGGEIEKTLTIEDRRKKQFSHYGQRRGANG